MIKYHAWRHERAIHKVEVEKETKNSVIIKLLGSPPEMKRYAKITLDNGYFDTFEEAKKKWICEQWENEVKTARRNLELAQSRLGNAKGLKETKDDYNSI